MEEEEGWKGRECDCNRARGDFEPKGERKVVGWDFSRSFSSLSIMSWTYCKALRVSTTFMLSTDDSSESNGVWDKGEPCKDSWFGGRFSLLIGGDKPVLKDLLHLLDCKGGRERGGGERERGGQGKKER